MRIAYVTESFPPDVNGVAVTATRVAEHLVRRGHHPVVIAPRPARSAPSLDESLGYPVVRVPAVGLPLYPGFRVGLPGPQVRAAIAAHGADVVHLAGPVVLGANGCSAAIALGLPTVAVYATDMAAYARTYHLGRAGEAICWRYLRGVHNAAGRTLAPSTATAATLAEHGFERVRVWGRGVDTGRFDPARRSAGLRARLAPDGEMIVGYVGRLAAEKRLDLLAEVAELPGVRLVIVGAGPAEAAARRALPGALFVGQRQGEVLARIYASLDIFVHAGPHDTFGNTLQEAAASGLPVVAPAAGGPLDLVDNGATGFLVEPGDARALADAVAVLTGSAELRAAQGAAARLAVLDRGWPARCDELIGHYNAVLGHALPGLLAGAAA
ncbi:MAG TPA: glycosyltransferase family 1 protein [Streptosporangiaceae bacterium]|nr:glycosyltransferase family 1 protein [Streptosporangiaceae bacterium]